MLSFINSSSRVLRPSNYLSTINKVWASCYRLPDYLLEPIFLDIFKKKESEFPTKQDIQQGAIEARNNSVSVTSQKQKVDYFSKSKNFENIKLATTLTNKQLTLTRNQFTPVSPRISASNLPKDTSSGYPEYEQRKVNIMDYTINIVEQLISNNDSSWKYLPSTMAWRTQVRPKAMKYRIIWVTSYISQIFENMFYSPIREYFEENKTTPWCVGNVFTDIKPRIQKLRQFNKIIVLDYSSFDISVPSELMIHFFRSIKQFFKIKSKIIDNMYEAVTFFNVYGTLLNKDNTGPLSYTKDGSVNSGSVFTNFMDSWINLFLLNLYMVEFQLDHTDYFPNVQGDDCVHGFTFDFDVNHFSRWLNFNFGMTISPDKCQELSNDFDTVEFLGSDMNEEGRYINKPLAIKQMIISERFIPESVLSTPERLISKVASICFKFKGGYLFFDEIMEQLLPKINLDRVPEFYYEITLSSSGPFEYLMKRKVVDYKFNGWMIQ